MAVGPGRTVDASLWRHVDALVTDVVVRGEKRYGARVAVGRTEGETASLARGYRQWKTSAARP
ncbi:MAG: hypothetical protein ACYDEY_00765 [Acidimicrobiales bacterium]